jgi:hypothetical protein
VDLRLFNKIIFLWCSLYNCHLHGYLAGTHGLAASSSFPAVIDRGEILKFTPIQITVVTRVRITQDVGVLIGILVGILVSECLSFHAV